MNRSRIFILLVFMSLVTAPVAFASDGYHWLEDLLIWIFDTAGGYIDPYG